MIRKFLLFSLLGITYVATCGYPSAEIRVIQGDDGKITLTDENYAPPKRKSIKTIKAGKDTSGNVTYVSHTSVHKVPSKYMDKIKDLADQHDLSEKLIIAVAKAESGFNPYAVSHKGAVGLMQLMAPTAMSYGVINRYNPDQNLEAGVKHLKYLYERYNHDVALTLAAYNAGEEAVKKYKGVPPYQETREYVRRIMAYMGLSYVSASPSIKTSTKIYKYRNASGSVTISDSYPFDAVGEVTIID